MTQKKVRDFMRNYPQPMNIQTCMNDLMSEVGEVAKEVNISTSWARYPDHKFRDNFKRELAQVLFCVYQLAEKADVDLEPELDEVIRVFTERYEIQGHTGSSNYIVGD